MVICTEKKRSDEEWNSAEVKEEPSVEPGNALTW